MNIKKLALLSVLATATMLGANLANAACTTYGPVEQVYTINGTTYVYVSPANAFPTPSYVYIFSTTNALIAQTMAASLHKNAYVSGNATTCPTTGTARTGGVASYMVAN